MVSFCCKSGFLKLFQLFVLRASLRNACHLLSLFQLCEDLDKAEAEFYRRSVSGFDLSNFGRFTDL